MLRTRDVPDPGVGWGSQCGKCSRTLSLLRAQAQNTSKPTPGQDMAQVRCVSLLFARRPHDADRTSGGVSRQDNMK
jgi:hypothetical protein